MKHLALIVTAGLVSSCGVVGAPVAPETVGATPIIESQKRQHEALTAQQREAASAAESEEPDPAMPDHDELLPPLRPVGTR
jgi:hypothetical protein